MLMIANGTAYDCIHLLFIHVQHCATHRGRSSLIRNHRCHNCHKEFQNWSCVNPESFVRTRPSAWTLPPPVKRMHPEWRPAEMLLRGPEYSRTGNLVITCYYQRRERDSKNKLYLWAASPKSEKVREIGHQKILSTRLDMLCCSGIF